MGRIYEQTNGNKDVPHRHDYYTVLLVEEANGEHIIDYQTYNFASNQVFFVGPGQVHQVVTPTKPSGWVITFSREFLVENGIPESFISNISLFRQFGEAPPLELDDTSLERLQRIVLDMEEQLALDLHYRNRALGALLQLFLICCNNSCLLDTNQLDEENASVCMLRDFKALVQGHYQEWHKVAQYAAEIHITPKHLSSTVKNLTGKTAKEIIQDRLTLEAKRLLLHTELNIKEIAYQLGFEEPLHFSGFFKKQTGVSPSSFRGKKR
jgi:AraC-like DNA-binding protein